MATPATGRPKGRPRKSAAQKIVEGNLAKKPLPQSLIPIEVNEDVPTPPSLGETGLRMWNQIWMAGQWLNADADYFAVEEACRNFEESELLRMERDLGLFPRTYKTPQGQILTHPKIAQLKDAQRALNLCLSEIGFTPSGRARLEISVKDETANPLNQIIEEGDNRKAQIMESYKVFMEMKQEQEDNRNE